MLRNADGESEILLGNAQLIGLFFLLAVLLGISFTAGFMLGHGSFGGKKGEAATAPSAGSTPDAGARTEVVEPAPSSASAEPPASPAGPTSSSSTDQKSTPDSDKADKRVSTEEAVSPVQQNEAFVPQQGQTFLQVAAELHDSAASTAAVLNKRGFNTHVVLAPNGKLFRVLVGPVKDKADLAATRDALKAKGFLQVIVRNY
jgi:cell division protein FtsN